MRTIIKDEDEVKIYHIVCYIYKIFKNYFYERKYLPKDCWSIDDVVKEILLSSKELKSKYTEIKQSNKSNKD